MAPSKTDHGAHLNRERILAALSEPDKFRLEVWQRLPSTNDDLFSLALEGAPAWTVVVADEQTAGKGRMGRRWSSPPGVGLWFSFLLRPQWPAARLMQLNLVICLLLASALEQFARQHLRVPLEVQLKWPNDLYLAGKKLAGLLLQSQYSGNKLQFVVVGVGLNVNQGAADFEPAIRSGAISLKMGTNQHWPREELLAFVLEALWKGITDFSRGRLKNWREQYLARALFLGKEIQVQTREGKQRGLFQDITREGFLLLKIGEQNQVITAGDVLIE